MNFGINRNWPVIRICIYATALICELCIYLVEVIELGYLDFGELIEKC